MHRSVKIRWRASAVPTVAVANEAGLNRIEGAEDAIGAKTLACHSETLLYGNGDGRSEGLIGNGRREKKGCGLVVASGGFA